eukprot:CAMPEP_0198131082 /NCGR_PEP_ID=MMETSP1442-20131203/55361_1 /TAXON_ID= /ORGANISM="Craspedostauros australis, Strain CCMP3328" /LENGTH=122 /DNA_ID=CAMNT_0043791819 /DNA_START=71 /DNA_END=436 /DNA_ORIENTATION=-
MFSTSAVRSLARREVARGIKSSVRAFASLEAYQDFGKAVFTGKVADEYLKKHGASGAVLKDPNWVNTDADVVANAVFDWAIDQGANVYCHWFHPMAASGVRHGLSGQVQNMMLKFNSDNEIV